MEVFPLEDPEFPLPPEVFEHIHSFIEGKEAVRTAIVSKSSYDAWSTRPNLDFNQSLFPHQFIKFIEFMNKTMQRYEDFNLRIETFKLQMIDDGYIFLVGFIMRAMDLGAVNLKIIESREGSSFILPVQVFGYESMASFSLSGGQIKLKENDEVNCSNLKSLHLYRVIINGDLFRSFILRCPLIEELICDADMLSFSNVRSENEFHKLESLSLNALKKIEAMFFQELLLKFPFLKNLAIRHIYDCGKMIPIYSQSLQSISIIEYYRAVKMEINAPNLRRFFFVGSPLSSLNFGPTGRVWESNIHIMCYQPSSSWLSSLRFFLLNLSQSKVSLSIYVKYPSKYICDYTSYGSYGPTPVVENFKILKQIPNSGLLNGLFMICRPKFVNVAPGKTELLELLCKKLVGKKSGNDHCIPNPRVHGLEEVNVELLEERNGKWQPLTWKTFKDASATHGNTHEFRFQLRWSPETCAP